MQAVVKKIDKNLINFAFNFFLICLRQLSLYWSLFEQKGKTVIIAAHGNSVRALCKHLDNVSDQDIMGLNIPTGKRNAFQNIRSSQNSNQKTLDDSLKRVSKSLTFLAS